MSGDSRTFYVIYSLTNNEDIVELELQLVLEA